MYEGVLFGIFVEITYKYGLAEIFTKRSELNDSIGLATMVVG